MSLILTDRNGYVGDLATNSGYAALQAWLEQGGEIEQACAALGYTDAPVALADAIGARPTPAEASLAATITGFEAMLRRAVGFAVIES